MKILNTFLVFGALLSACPSFADSFVESEAAVLLTMKDLQLSPNSVPQIGSLQIASDADADQVTLTLTYPSLPAIQLVLRGPHGFWQKQDQSEQILFLTTGFFTGADSTLLLGSIPNTVFVGFSYPYGINDFARDPATLLQTFRVTPGQVALALKWVSLQAWAHPSGLVVMGVSLGGLFLPASLRIAQKLNVPVAHTVFAFTGADLPVILENNLRGQIPDVTLSPLLALVPAINTLNDPSLHLPYLSGPFLVIRGDQDQVIPASATAELWQLLPNPKQEVVLHGSHIDVDKTDLIQQTKAAVLSWLQQR